MPVVVAEEVADFILQHWRQVHEVPIEVWEIDPEQIAAEPERAGKSRRQWPLFGLMLLPLPVSAHQEPK